MKNEFYNLPFKVLTEDGKEIECETLFTFETEETGKNYIVYTDNTKDDEGNTRIYASTYDPNSSEDNCLKPIETDEEWRIIETILAEMQAEARRNLNLDND